MLMNLYGHEGEHKYLTPGEREAFLKAADDAACECGHSAAPYTGCRNIGSIRVDRRSGPESRGAGI